MLKKSQELWSINIPNKSEIQLLVVNYTSAVEGDVFRVKAGVVVVGLCMEKD